MKATLAREPLRVGDARTRAGQHDLARPVVVGDDKTGLRDEGRGALRGAASEDRDHATRRAGGDRFVAQPAAQDDEPERIVLVEHARGDQRRDLTERVPGEGDDVRIVRNVHDATLAQKTAGCR